MKLLSLYLVDLANEMLKTQAKTTKPFHSGIEVLL